MRSYEKKKGLLPDNPQKQSWRCAMHFAQWNLPLRCKSVIRVYRPVSFTVNKALSVLI
jgi:hypothetical protein